MYNVTTLFPRKFHGNQIERHKYIESHCALANHLGLSF